jgi:hypothetical protein
MEVCGDEDEEASDQVEEETGDRQAQERAEDRFEPSCSPVDRFARGDSPLQAARAEKFPFVLCHALPAKKPGTRRTAGNRFPIRVNQASLQCELHRDYGEKMTMRNEPQIAQNSQGTVDGALAVGRDGGFEVEV